MYLGQFKDKEDVMSNFEVSDADLENCKILFAAYDQEGYEGYAMVIFSKDGKLFEVNGSHCSCNGLEGQWEPEETSLEALKKRNYCYGGIQSDLSRFLIDYVFEEDVLQN